MAQYQPNRFQEKGRHSTACSWEDLIQEWSDEVYQGRHTLLLYFFDLIRKPLIDQIEVFPRRLLVKLSAAGVTNAALK